MDENKFDEALRGLNIPPAPPLDEMWAVIEDAHFNNIEATAPATHTSRLPWLAAAATLILGIGIGRYVPIGKTEAATGTASPAANAADRNPRGYAQPSPLRIAIRRHSTSDRQWHFSFLCRHARSTPKRMPCSRASNRSPRNHPASDGFTRRAGSEAPWAPRRSGAGCEEIAQTPRRAEQERSRFDPPGSRTGRRAVVVSTPPVVTTQSVE